MSPEALLALIGILAAASWTPGPNNAMLAASGATFGFRRTQPHISGVAIGFPAMLFAVALGMGGLFERWPELAGILRWLGAAALIYVAWRIATADGPEAGAGRRARPFSFWQAMAFQWVNPKAWVICLAIAAQFVTGANALRAALICALVAAVAGLSSSLAWAGLGVLIARWLATPARVRAFNLAMAALIALSVLSLFADPT